MRCQRNLRIRHHTLHACCCGSEGGAAAAEAAADVWSSSSIWGGGHEQVHVTDWMEHLTVCVCVCVWVCVSVCVWDSVLYVSQWIVFNVARLKLPAWTSFSAFPLYFLFFLKKHYLFIEDPVSAALSFSRNRSFHISDHKNTSWQSNLVAGITWKSMKISLAELFGGK